MFYVREERIDVCLKVLLSKLTLRYCLTIVSDASKILFNYAKLLRIINGEKGFFYKIY